MKPGTSAEFTTAMREAGFGVDHGRIVDVSGQCPGFATAAQVSRLLKRLAENCETHSPYCRL
jgi:hypothetical protein